MSSKKIIILITSACVIGAGLFLLLDSKDNGDTVIMDNSYTKDEVKEIISGITVEETTKKVPFETVEEANEYIATLHTIQGEEEAKDYITAFLRACENNKIDIMASYFDEEYWETVIQHEIVPAYDKTNTYCFEYSDISVKEKVAGSEYTVRYKLTVKDSKTMKVHSEFIREDLFKLRKEFEHISIVDYERNTKSYKIF